MKINIKPLSVNRAWQGKRYKTQEYKEYERELMLRLPSQSKLKNTKEKLRIEIVVGYSNKASDIDNFLKPFLDILQKKYEFDDKNIYELSIIKDVVKKGNEYIDFGIWGIGD